MRHIARIRMVNHRVSNLYVIDTIIYSVKMFLISLFYTFIYFSVYHVIIYEYQYSGELRMLKIPSVFQTQFEAYLRNKALPNNVHVPYVKWLRFYLDFCQKYHFTPTYSERGRSCRACRKIPRK